MSLWAMKSQLMHKFSETAIAHVAVLWGLERVRLSIKYCRFHYGWSWSFPFREGVDCQKYAHIEPYNGTKMCSGRMNWVVNKGCVGILSTGNNCAD
jgi:hypothetical protein